MKVAQYQRNLNFLDYGAGEVDGEHGLLTAKALATMQCDYWPSYKDTIDGVWGKNSEKMMIAAIKEIQAALKTLKHYAGDVDGEVGNLTETAVRKLQKEKRLAKVDGVCRIAVLKKLGLYPIARQRRNAFLIALESHVGANEADGTDDPIIREYNDSRLDNYKLSLEDPWCGAYVSVAAEESNNLDIIRQAAYVPNFTNWAKNNGLYYSTWAVPPIAGMILIFGDDDHVGAVKRGSVANGQYIIHTYEGNVSDSCMSRKLLANSYYHYILPKFWTPRR